MNDKELTQVLAETWPIRPGQETRAWNSLHDNLQGVLPSPARSFLGWPSFLAGALAVGLVAFCVFRLETPLMPPLSAASQSPGIFATAFYSQPAKAQVVWLNGMDPATDGPTYMDPSTKVEDSVPAGRSDRL